MKLYNIFRIWRIKVEHNDSFYNWSIVVIIIIGALIVLPGFVIYDATAEMSLNKVRFYLTIAVMALPVALGIGALLGRFSHISYTVGAKDALDSSEDYVKGISMSLSRAWRYSRMGLGFGGGTQNVINIDNDDDGGDVALIPPINSGPIDL